jgi:hypothetical protein
LEFAHYFGMRVANFPTRFAGDTGLQCLMRSTTILVSPIATAWRIFNRAGGKR